MPRRPENQAPRQPPQPRRRPLRHGSPKTGFRTNGRPAGDFHIGESEPPVREEKPRLPSHWWRFSRRSASAGTTGIRGFRSRGAKSGCRRSPKGERFRVLPSNRVTTLDAKFQLSTKWLPDQTTNGSANYKNGELKYKLNIRGYPKALKEAWRSEFNSSYFITIHLLDKDDFEITSLEITLDQLTRTVNPKGDGIGFSMQGAEKMSLRTYRRIDDWKISWNL